MKEIEYYKNITSDNTVREGFNKNSYISHSSLSAINPDDGGSPKKFLDFFYNREESKSQAMNLGKLVHKWQESPDDFIVADFNKPSDGTIQAVLPELIVKKITDKSELKLVDVGEGKFKVISEDFHKSLIEEAGFKRADALGTDALRYLDYLYDSQGKIALTRDEASNIKSMLVSIINNRRINEALFLDKMYEGNHELNINDDFRRYKELAIYWEEKIGNITIQRKALLDVFTYFPKGNQVTIIDLKTTSKGVYNGHSDNSKKGWLETYKVYRQMAYYTEAVLNLFLNPNAYAMTTDGRRLSPKTKTPPSIYNYVAAIDTNYPHNSAMLHLNDYTIVAGEREVKKILNRIAWHIEKDIWDKSKEEYDNAGMVKIDYSNIDRFKPTLSPIRNER